MERENLDNLTDEQLVQRVTQNNKELYSQIIKRYQSKLIRYASYLLFDPDKAMDVVQEAFIKAYINLNSFDTKKKFSSWLYRIVHNEAINMVEKHKKTIPLDPDIDFDSGYNIEEDYLKSELTAHAQDCLKQMDIIYSEPLSLYYLENKSYEEIGDILRIPVGTVGTRINRAKVIMRKICQKKMKQLNI